MCPWKKQRSNARIPPEHSDNNMVLSGWWFGTFFIFHILGIIIPTDFHIFQRGSNHQPVTTLCYQCISMAMQQEPIYSRYLPFFQGLYKVQMYSTSILWSWNFHWTYLSFGDHCRFCATIPNFFSVPSELFFRAEWLSYLGRWFWSRTLILVNFCLNPHSWP